LTSVPCVDNVIRNGILTRNRSPVHSSPLLCFNHTEWKVGSPKPFPLNRITSWQYHSFALSWLKSL